MKTAILRMSLMLVIATGSLFVALSGREAGGAVKESDFDTTKVAPNVYTFRWGTHRNMFVVTPQGVLVTDPLNPKAAKQLSKEIRKVTEAPVKYVVYSHEHWDHILGGRIFKEQGARFVSHGHCVPHFEKFPNPELIMPDIIFDGAAHDLKLGAKTFELRYFGPNHGECTVVVRLPEEKILYVVDLANPQTVGYRILPDFQPLELVRSLKEIERLQFDRIIPGHMAPEAPAKVVAEQRRYYEDLITAVKSAMDRGVHDPAALAKSIELPRYRDWAGYDDWLPLNVERVWAYFHMGW